MKLLTTLLAITVLALPALAQQGTPGPASADIVLPITGQQLTKTKPTATSIGVAPEYLHPGDQAVLLIVSWYQKGQSEPIRLNLAHPDAAAIDTIELFNRSIVQQPVSLLVSVYHIALKTDSFEFTPADFTNLPPGFKFPKLKIKRVTP